MPNPMSRREDSAKRRDALRSNHIAGLHGSSSTEPSPVRLPSPLRGCSSAAARSAQVAANVELPDGDDSLKPRSNVDEFEKLLQEFVAVVGAPRTPTQPRQTR